MITDFDYSIKCKTKASQERLIYTFIKWVGSTNIDLADEGYELLKVTDYKRQVIEREELIGHNLPSTLIFEDAKRLNRPIVFDGLTISIENSEWLSNMLSLVFLDIPGSKYDGLNVYPYSDSTYPLETSIGYPAFRRRTTEYWCGDLLRVIASIDPATIKVLIGDEVLESQNAIPVESQLSFLTGAYIKDVRSWE